YCDKVVLLNKGEFIAEGEPGRMVDLYKKILANQMDSLREELENDFSGGMEIEGSEKKVLSSREAAAAHTGADAGLMKEKITINTDRTEYGDGRAEIFDLGLFDARGNLTNLLIKGETFTIKERIRFNAPLQNPIFTYTIRDKKGTDLSGTNTMYEGADVKPVGPGDVYDVSFTQKMTLQGGEYLLSMSCTGFEGEEHVVYHRLYNVANITVISNKNTVGIYDMESEVETTLTRG
ncbi:MAG: Wzt carbohydrate-binding domain-containing protein, partial [Lachnospiraceae bacterium]|nr:Wzt carbohydrate-binding domain-containing protein [Lachnospiraceae bacterium]